MNLVWHNVGLTLYIKHLFMKASTSTTVILKSIDLELKKLLQQDLAAFKAKQQKANNQTASVKRAA